MPRSRKSYRNRKLRGGSLQERLETEADAMGLSHDVLVAERIRLEKLSEGSVPAWEDRRILKLVQELIGLLEKKDGLDGSDIATFTKKATTFKTQRAKQMRRAFLRRQGDRADEAGGGEWDAGTGTLVKSQEVGGAARLVREEEGLVPGKKTLAEPGKTDLGRFKPVVDAEGVPHQPMHEPSELVMGKIWDNRLGRYVDEALRTHRGPRHDPIPLRVPEGDKGKVQVNPMRLADPPEPTEEEMEIAKMRDELRGLGEPTGGSKSALESRLTQARARMGKTQLVSGGKNRKSQRRKSTKRKRRKTKKRRRTNKKYK